jgi:nitrous oxide reductase accessory protein NosL
MARRVAVSIALAAVLAATGLAADRGPIEPSATDKCPVCGMFTARFPDFLAQIVFEDGSHLTFDGPKDLFNFTLRPERYGSKRISVERARIYVTEYYSLAPIDARTAFFVAGSDVRGPMGAELIPFATRDDAEAFRADHRGTGVLRFEEVTGDAIRELDSNR